MASWAFWIESIVSNWMECGRSNWFTISILSFDVRIDVRAIVVGEKERELTTHLLVLLFTCSRSLASVPWSAAKTFFHYARPSYGETQSILEADTSTDFVHSISAEADYDPQVFLVILFWISRIVVGNPSAPRILYLRRINRVLARFTPWQLILSTLTALYTLRHFDQILPGLACKSTSL